MSVEKHAVRLAEVYQKADAAAYHVLLGRPRGSDASHFIAMELVKVALNEDILAEWIKPETEG